MTKKVRIENADTSNYKVAVQVWAKGANGEPDAMVEERTLHHAADIAEFYIHSGRYIIVKEPD